MASNGPVNSNTPNNSFFVGSRTFGKIPFFLSDLSIKPELNKVANAVAAAAPLVPSRNGQTHMAASPTIFTKHANAIIFKGVIASRVAIIVDRAQL